MVLGTSATNECLNKIVKLVYIEENGKMAQKKMILDLDAGVGDALALAYELATPDADLIGITSSYGNNVQDITSVNSLKLLELLGATDVPVFRGVDHSLNTDSFEAMQVSKDIHGDNGIGNVVLPEPKRPIEDQSAVDFLIEAAHEYAENLVTLPGTVSAPPIIVILPINSAISGSFLNAKAKLVKGPVGTITKFSAYS